MTSVLSSCFVVIAPKCGRRGEINWDNRKKEEGNTLMDRRRLIAIMDSAASHHQNMTLFAVHHRSTGVLHASSSHSLAMTIADWLLKSNPGLGNILLGYPLISRV
jgi:hypothetical protein